MKVYVTASQMPEMRRLTKVERSQAYKECIHPLLTSWLIMFARSATFVFLALMLYDYLSLSLSGILFLFVIFLTADYSFDAIVWNIRRNRISSALAAWSPSIPTATPAH